MNALSLTTNAPIVFSGRALPRPLGELKHSPTLPRRSKGEGKGRGKGWRRGREGRGGGGAEREEAFELHSPFLLYIAPPMT